MNRVNENQSCKPDWLFAAVFHIMNTSFLLVLPTDTTHSHSQVAPLTISIKQHPDQMETFFSLPSSLVLFFTLPLPIKRAIKVNQMNYFVFFFLHNSVCLLTLCGNCSVYLRTSFFSPPQAPVITHLSPCVLKVLY